MEEPYTEVIQRNRRRECERVLVGLDAIKDRDDDYPALKWVFAKLARSGDTVVVLAVIYNKHAEKQEAQPGCLPFRRMQQVGVSKEDLVKRLKYLHEEISNKKESYMESLRPFYDRCKTKGVKMEIKFSAGYRPTYITVHEANNAQASWIVLDRHLEKYKNEIADSSGRNVAVIMRNDVATILSSENKLPSYSISEQGTINTVPTAVRSVDICDSSISDGEIEANRLVQEERRPSISLYTAGRSDLAENFNFFVDCVQNPSQSEEKTALMCSVSDVKNKLSSKAIFSPPRELSYDEVTKITNGFSEDCFLVQNEFWQLYKGILVEDGRLEHDVLVKKLDASYLETHFRTEIDILSVARHCNILTLLGFCNDKSSPALVYEYAFNGSLDRRLSSEKEKMLSWAARQRIAIGVGNGLKYLNEECGDCAIVHRDIQPANILLTHDFLPLICNFGSAKRLQSDEVCRDCRVWGTAGYVAPECAERGIVSVKADTYSFGVLLLELISGRKALDLSRSEEQQSLLEWARPLVEIHAFHEVVDPGIADTVDMYELYCMISAASVCIRKDPCSRPSMSHVVSILKGGRT